MTSRPFETLLTWNKFKRHLKADFPPFFIAFLLKIMRKYLLRNLLFQGYPGSVIPKKRVTAATMAEQPNMPSGYFPADWRRLCPTK